MAEEATLMVVSPDDPEELDQVEEQPVQQPVQQLEEQVVEEQLPQIEEQPLIEEQVEKEEEEEEEEEKESRGEEEDEVRASRAVAERHALATALTEYDGSTDTYKWRSVYNTTREQLGQYGVGVQLYFELLYYLGVCFAVMTGLTLPLAALSYLGDFGGSAAGTFVRLTAGNLGKCGEFGELCPDSLDLLDRKLFDATTWNSAWVAANLNWRVRDVAMYFGILDGLAVLVIFVLIVYFDKNVVGKIVREQDEANVTPADFGIQVMLLPKRLVPEMHATYADLLKRHFEQLVGEEGAVSEVTLVRDYDRSVAVFMEIGQLEREVVEYKARVADLEALPSLTKRQRREKDQANKYVEKCEKQINTNKKKLKSQQNVLDSERDVITAFVILNAEKFKELILHKYRWASMGGIFRYFQSRKIRFVGRALLVREAPEPSDLYQENLDMPKRQKTIRRSITGCFSFGLLLLCTGLMIWAQSALTKVAVADEASKVWVMSKVAPSSGDNKCFSACEIQMYPDRSCEVSDLLEDITIFDSTLKLDPARRLVNGEFGGVSDREDPDICSATGFWFPGAQNGNTEISCGPLGNQVEATAENECVMAQVTQVLSTSLSCGNSFWANPCCYSTVEITTAERDGVLACDAHEMDSRVPPGVRTVGDWVDDVCAAKTAFDNLALVTCQADDVNKLASSSPACQHLLTVSGARSYCECAADLRGLIPVSSGDFAALDCDVYGATFLGQDNPLLSVWSSSRATLQQRLDWTCEDAGRAPSASSSLGTELRVWLQLVNPTEVAWLTSDASLALLSIVLSSTEVEYFGAQPWTRVSAKLAAGLSASTSKTALEAVLTANAAEMVTKSSVEILEDAEICGEGFVQCGGLDECIHEDRLCDGFPDCAWENAEGVSWDEMTCESIESTVPVDPTTGCLPNQFACPSGSCLEDVFWCDGVADCDGGSDDSDETNEECLIRNQQLSAASMPSISEWAGFRFSDSLAPKGVKLGQSQAVAAAQGEEASRLKLFNCEEDVVFRNNKITLRDPYLLCRSVATVGFNLATVEAYTGVKYAEDAHAYPYTVRAVCTVDADCSDGNGYLAEGVTCVAGICRQKTKSISSATPVSYDPNLCPLSRPVSIVAARAVHQRYGGKKEDILQDPTYKCYCQQQVQYRISSDPLYLFGPYETDDKKICEEYLKQQIVVQSMVVASILAVSFLNFFLRTAMMFFAEFEKHDSLSATVYSEMRKLFLVLFVNTAIIILLVNAKFQNIAEYTVIGFGKGSFSDFTKDWFVVVGAGFAMTIIVQTLSIIIAPIVTAYIFYWLQKRSAVGFKTQDKMNTYYEYPHFSLSLRLAQTLMIVFACLLYSGGVPVLNLLAFVYIVMAYWADKWVLLRLSKIPPQYDAEIISTSSKLIVFGVLVHCLFTIYMFTNQIVMPSDFINETAQSWFLSQVDMERYYEYLFSDIPAKSEAYTFFIQARMLDCFRKGAAGNMVVAIIVLFYLSFGTIVRAVFAVIRFLRGCFRCGKSAPRYSGTTEETYNDSVNEMIRNRVLHTYQGAQNPRYALAFRAIKHLDIETSTMRANAPAN